MCSVRSDRGRERLVVVLRKYFSDAANEFYGTCACVCAGGGDVEVGVYDGLIWLRDKRLGLAKKLTG